MATFLHNACLPLLLRSQNSDGGWAYRPGRTSRVEPTSWALLALAGCTDTDGVALAVQTGERWLLACQAADGSWPAGPPDGTGGGWVTSLACLYLASQCDAGDPLHRGLQWLSQAWPADFGWRWRTRRWIFGLRNEIPVQHDPSVCGWSWNVGTASWVEPTSYALLALQCAPQKLLPRLAARRCELGIRFLLDRACEVGGWNCGDPAVYGIPGEPQVVQTAWALLALRRETPDAKISRSLAWLEQALPTLKSPASLAVGHLCLAAREIRLPPLAASLEEFFARSRFFDNVVDVAWSALALSPLPRWLKTPEPAEAR